MKTVNGNRNWRLSMLYFKKCHMMIFQGNISLKQAEQTRTDLVKNMFYFLPEHAFKEPSVLKSVLSVGLLYIPPQQ